jgi:hypothetical protein
MLEAYVDDTLDDADREIVEGHFAVCPACVAEARELRALRSELLAAPAASPQAVLEAIAPPPAAPPTVARRSWFRSIAVPAFAAAGAAVLMALLILPLLRARLAKAEQRAARAEAARRVAEDAQHTAEGNQQIAEERLRSAKTARRASAAENADLRRKLAALQRAAPAPSPAPSPTFSPASAGGPPLPNAVRVALADGKLRLPDLSQLDTSAPIPRGGAAAKRTFPLEAPEQTRILSDHPVFLWEPVAGAVRYSVRVVDEGDNDTVLAQTDDPTPVPMWQSVRALPRGRPLAWQVYAEGPDGHEIALSATARFIVIGADEARRLESVRKALLAADQPLTWAVAAAQAGLMTEAEGVFRHVLESPQTTEVDRRHARRLFAGLRANRGGVSETSSPTETNTPRSGDSPDVKAARPQE